MQTPARPIVKLEILGHKVEILQAGNRRTVAYPAPRPTGKQADKIEAYLRAEGFLPEENPEASPTAGPKDYMSPGIKIWFKDGSFEFFQAGTADILQFDEHLHTITLINNGKTLELEGVKAVECTEN